MRIFFGWSPAWTRRDTGSASREPRGQRQETFVGLDMFNLLRLMYVAGPQGVKTRSKGDQEAIGLSLPRTKGSFQRGEALRLSVCA